MSEWIAYLKNDEMRKKVGTIGGISWEERMKNILDEIDKGTNN